ncbi:MAG: hypothetical protein HYZ54_09870 [Ignavibacteriae bacterium]|nr:hypothetical protein [Ignavibacteriota bacterium]
MKIHLRNISYLYLIVIGLSGCASSLVYSPSMQLPVQPLKKEQGQAGFGIVMLPETRPAAVGQKNSLGAEGFLRYAFSNNFSLQARYWHDLESDNNLYGASLAGTYVFEDSNSATRYGLTCATGVLFNSSSSEGGGTALICSIWLPEFSTGLRPYCSLGAIIGYRHLNTNPKEWGAGLLVQGGIGWKLSSVWTLHLEGSFIGQMNSYDDISHGIPSVSIAASIAF